MEKGEKRILAYLKRKQRLIQNAEFTTGCQDLLHLATLRAEVRLKRNEVDSSLRLLKQRGFVEFDADGCPSSVRITHEGMDASAPVWVRERAASVGWAIAVVATIVSLLATYTSFRSANSAREAQALYNRDLKLRYMPAITVSSLQDGTGYIIRNMSDFSVSLVSRHMIVAIGDEWKFYPAFKEEVLLVGNDSLTFAHSPQVKQDAEKTKGRGGVMVACQAKSLFDGSIVNVVREFRCDIDTGLWLTAFRTEKEWEEVKAKVESMLP